MLTIELDRMSIRCALCQDLFTLEVLSQGAYTVRINWQIDWPVVANGLEQCQSGHKSGRTCVLRQARIRLLLCNGRVLSRALIKSYRVLVLLSTD